MAIARLTGTQTFHGNDTATEREITVPAGTTCVVVAITGYHDVTLTSVNMDGTASFTIDVAPAPNASVNNVYLAHYINASLTTGSRTLNINWSGEPSYVQYSVIYYSGVDTTTTTARDADSSSGDSPPSVTVTTVSGDVCVGVAAVDGNVTWTNATSFIEATARAVRHEVADMTADGTSETIAITQNYGADSLGVIVLRMGGESSSTPILKRRFNVLLRLCLSTFNLIWRCFK